MDPVAASSRSDSTDVSFGALWNETLRLLKAHPLPLLLLPVLLGILTGAGSGRPRYAYTPGATPVDWHAYIPFFALFGALALVVLVLVAIASAWVALVTTRAALDALATGREPDLGASVRGVQAHYWSGLGTLVLWALIVILGFILLIVPGFVALAGLFPIAAVIVAEGRTGMDAVRRAWELTKGHKGTIFLVGLVLLLINVVVGVILSILPLIGGVLSGALGGAVNGALLVAATVFFARRTAATSPPAAPPASPTPPSGTAPPPAW